MILSLDKSLSITASPLAFFRFDLLVQNDTVKIATKTTAMIKNCPNNHVFDEHLSHVCNSM